MKKALFILVPVVLVLVYLAATRGLYFYPTSIALGPCLPDWTSPSTWTGFFEPPASPMQTVRFRVGNANVQICYGQPSARGRTIFETVDSLGVAVRSGQVDSTRIVARPAPLVPNNRIWRMGANEPTRLFTDRAIRLGDLTIPSGRYSLYARPSAEEWEIFVTRSTFHWGNMITSDVRAQEVGSTRVPVASANDYVERLTIRAAPPGNATVIVVEWADRSVTIPVVELD